MAVILNKREYESQLAKSRDKRMKWWREARFGMFVHYGLFSQAGGCEWEEALGNYPKEEYEEYANSFDTAPGAPRQWVKLAKNAGAKYVIMTTRHHEGFSLWDSKVNPINSVNYGPHRDLVREFVDACREFDMKVGFYSSLMDWHNPDGWKCMTDPEARRRFLDYIEALNVELLTNYGKLDILWYDVAMPLDGWDAWESVIRNQRLRELQPDIIINNRSLLDEDYGTPEETVEAGTRNWEACMTMNGMTWCYTDENQVGKYNYTSAQILRMLNKCSREGGNLLLNFGPRPDGTVPSDVVGPLKEVGEWLSRNGEAAYGLKKETGSIFSYAKGGNGTAHACGSEDNKTIYLWCWIWRAPTMHLGGYLTAPKKITILNTGEEVEFTHDGARITFKNLSAECPDPLGICVLKMEFDQEVVYKPASRFPQLCMIDPSHSGPVTGTKE